MARILSDLRVALCTFRRNPGFTAIAVLSIALGIGANTAIFTLVDQVLLRLLPVKKPQQLVHVHRMATSTAATGAMAPSSRTPCTRRSAIRTRSSRACSAGSATTCTSGFGARRIASRGTRHRQLLSGPGRAACDRPVADTRRRSPRVVPRSRC